MPQISRRSQQFTESVIRRMTRIADQHGAINLSQGFPDFDPPQALMDALAHAAHAGPHQYEVTYGAQGFREALARKYSQSFGRLVDADSQVLVTCGATEAMICALLALVNPGDRVGIFSPFYENYAADCLIAGAQAVYVPLVPPAYEVDWQALEAAFHQGLQALVVCNPSNPCGKVFTREELQRIGSLARAHQAWVITDEVYEHIVFAPHAHTHLAALPGMWDNTITVSSLSKTYSITGWRLGHLMGPEAAVEAARKVHDFLTVGAAAPLQAAALPGLLAGAEYYLGLRELYTQKRDFFLSGLDRLGLPHNSPQGSYFVLVDVGQLLDKPPYAGMDSLALCAHMAQHLGVAAVPGSSFFPDSSGDHLIRLHFARGQDSLAEALRRLEGLRA
ncbi:MAG: aminotransferase class I/II-fold pyridoxal phosphate-dependent enzyme [Clostridiales bacterium]|nr:aminotransferase class I/II-fold pyridoxal phosphate-dependent enzyme [Clostridiales bacterium]